MNERRQEAAHLGLRHARHRRQEAGTAVALVDLERRPGHRLLDGRTHGRTAERCVAARATRDRLWRDFARYTDLLAATDRSGRLLRGDPARLRALLDDADASLAGVRGALHELQALASACETTRSSVLAALAPVAERLACARRTVAALGLARDDPDAVTAGELTARASELERDATGDPLAFSGTPGPVVVAAVAGPVDALRGRLELLARLRDGWDATVAGLDRDVERVAERRARLVRARAGAAAELRDVVPARPPDRGPELRDLRGRVTTVDGWRDRHDAVVALRERLSAARRELDATATLVAQQLERRDDLRERFGAYRALTRRLGFAGDPELTELAAHIVARLWTVPSEVARATRDLAAYRRRLTVLAGR